MDTDEPMLRVVRGSPTAEEVAALVAVLVTRARPAPDADPPRASAWVRSARPGATTRGLPRERGRNAWRISALPPAR